MCFGGLLSIRPQLFDKNAIIYFRSCGSLDAPHPGGLHSLR